MHTRGVEGAAPYKDRKGWDAMELPQRKPNRLSDFDYNQNGAHFITICTQDRRKILSHIVGGSALDAPVLTLTKIGEIAQKYILSSNRIPGICVDKFVIMPDHIHLIVQVTETASMGTSRVPSPTNMVIPHFVSTFKRFCHREVGATIFQRSYYDHVIRTQKDYNEVWEYIENKVGTEAFKEMLSLMQQFPNYKIQVATRAATKKACDYKGLTFDYMEKYIAAHDDEKKSIMTEYQALRGVTAEAKDALAESCSYKEIKDR